MRKMAHKTPMTGYRAPFHPVDGISLALSQISSVYSTDRRALYLSIQIIDKSARL